MSGDSKEPAAPTVLSEYLRQLIAARRRKYQRQGRPRWRAVLDLPCETASTASIRLQDDFLEDDDAI